MIKSAEEKVGRRIAVNVFVANDLKAIFGNQVGCRPDQEPKFVPKRIFDPVLKHTGRNVIIMHRPKSITGGGSKAWNPNIVRSNFVLREEIISSPTIGSQAILEVRLVL